MIAIGRVLLVVGFLAGAFATVRKAPDGSESEREVRWPHFVPAVAMCIVGVALLRASHRQESRDEARVAARLEDVERSLAGIVASTEALREESGEIDVYDLGRVIDERFPKLLDEFVVARESISHAYGIHAYTEVMSHFAAGERYLHRVWSCSVDGYIDEAHASLARSDEEFRAARDALGRHRPGDDGPSEPTATSGASGT